MFPKHDHLRVKKFVERNAPRALRSPQRSTKANQPRAMACGACFAILHRTACELLALPLYHRHRTSNFELNASCRLVHSVFDVFSS